MPRVPKPSEIEVVDEAVAAILRTKTPAERIAMACAQWHTARLLLEAQVLRHHPEWSEADRVAEVNRRLVRGTT